MTTTQSKQAKHTPGPWKHEVWLIGEKRMDELTIVSQTDSIAVIKSLWVRPHRRNEQEANANLIAAAPELLAACKMALEEGDDYKAIEALKSAIAKAEGEP